MFLNLMIALHKNLTITISADMITFVNHEKRPRTLPRAVTSPANEAPTHAKVLPKSRSLPIHTEGMKGVRL